MTKIEIGYFIVKKKQHIGQNECTETVNFTGNLIIINNNKLKKQIELYIYINADTDIYRYIRDRPISIYLYAPLLVVCTHLVNYTI